MINLYNQSPYEVQTDHFIQIIMGNIARAKSVLVQSFKFVSIFFYKTSPHKLKNWHSQDVDLDLWSLDVISMILKQLQYTYFNLTYLNYQYW